MESIMQLDIPRILGTRSVREIWSLKEASSQETAEVKSGCHCTVQLHW